MPVIINIKFQTDIVQCKFSPHSPAVSRLKAQKWLALIYIHTKLRLSQYSSVELAQPEVQYTESTHFIRAINGNKSGFFFF